MPVLVAARCARVLGYQRLEGRVVADGLVEGKVLVIRHCSVAAFVFAGHTPPLRTSAVADHWRTGDFEALALALRYIAVAGR